MGKKIQAKSTSWLGFELLLLVFFGTSLFAAIWRIEQQAEPTDEPALPVEHSVSPPKSCLPATLPTATQLEVSRLGIAQERARLRNGSSLAHFAFMTSLLGEDTRSLPPLKAQGDQQAIWVDVERAPREEFTDKQAACTYLQQLTEERDWSEAPDEATTREQLTTAHLSLAEKAWLERADTFCSQITVMLNRYEGRAGPKARLKEMCGGLRQVQDSEWAAAQTEVALDLAHYEKAVEIAQQLDAELMVEHNAAVEEAARQHQAALAQHAHAHKTWLQAETTRIKTNLGHRRAALINGALAGFVLLAGIATTMLPWVPVTVTPQQVRVGTYVFEAHNLKKALVFNGRLLLNLTNGGVVRFHVHNADELQQALQQLDLDHTKEAARTPERIKRRLYDPNTKTPASPRTSKNQVSSNIIKALASRDTRQN